MRGPMAGQKSLSYAWAKIVSMSMLLALLMARPLFPQTDSLSSAPIGTDESSLSVNLGGPTYALSLAFGQYMAEKVEGEIGLGFVGLYGGLRYHVLYKQVGRQREFISPYTGLFYSYGAFFDSSFALAGTAGLYLPLGVQYRGLEHFQFAAELALVKLLQNKPRFERDLFPWLCLRFGWYF